MSQRKLTKEWQDPVLFSGTIRSNLDPFNERTDLELRAALARVHLIDSEAPTLASESSSAAQSVATSNTNIFRDLSSPVTESGENLSQGQRQLLCRTGNCFAAKDNGPG